MAHTNVIPFPVRNNHSAVTDAETHIVFCWREMFREFKRTHTTRLRPDEQELLKGLLATDRPSSFSQWMRGMSFIGKYATANKARRYMSAVAAPVLDLCARNTAQLSLSASARDEFLAGHAAEAAQFPIVERYADCSDAQLVTALRASENHMVSIEIYCETLRAELARREQQVAA